jgi:hypothetical protein
MVQKTTANIRLTIFLLLSILVLASCDQRDLSTPSSRLVGHWRSRTFEYYFSAVNPQTNEGIFIQDIEGIVLYGVYQIISEEQSGKELVILFRVPEVGQGRGLFRIEQNGVNMEVREFPYPKANYVALYVDDQLEPE